MFLYESVQILFKCSLANWNTISVSLHWIVHQVVGLFINHIQLQTNEINVEISWSQLDVRVIDLHGRFIR